MPKPSPPTPAESDPVFYYAADYILLPPYHPPRRRRCLLLSAAAAFLLLASSAYLLWPSDPDLAVARLRIDRLRVSPDPVSLDVVVDLTVRVRNRAFYSLDYRSLVVSIAYRGHHLGSVSSADGRVRARSASYVDATLRLDGVQVLHDALYLIQDIARGVIPFDAITVVEGELGFFAFHIPIEVWCSSSVYVHSEVPDFSTFVF